MMTYEDRRSENGKNDKWETGQSFLSPSQNETLLCIIFSVVNATYLCS
jgi:hypothetical protein